MLPSPLVVFIVVLYASVLCAACSPSLGVVAMAAVGPDGRLLLGPDGQGLRLGPDRVKLVTAAGRPVLSDKGTQLGLAANGEKLVIPLGWVLSYRSCKRHIELMQLVRVNPCAISLQLSRRHH